jgi:hypothetical protein
MPWFRLILYRFIRATQGDIIYEVDNFVVFRQPFNLWASVFNGSRSAALSQPHAPPPSPLPPLPDAFCRGTWILHSYHAAKAKYESTSKLNIPFECHSFCFQVLAHISLMRPSLPHPASTDASRSQGPSLILVPGPRPAAAAPVRLSSESDASGDLMPRGRSNVSEESNSGSSAFMRSRQAEEAAARARSLSNESQMNVRSSPWQEGGSEQGGTAAGARRPSASVIPEGSNSRATHHVSALSASDPLAVFEKPLLAALSGDEVGGMQAAEVSHQHPPSVDRICDICLQDSSDPYMARASYYERLGRAARKYREGLSKDALDSSQ